MMAPIAAINTPTTGPPTSAEKPPSTTAALRPHAGRVGRDVGSGQAAAVHIVVVDELPDRPVVAPAGRGDDRLVDVVAVVVGDVRDVVAEVVERDVFGAREEAAGLVAV